MPRPPSPPPFTRRPRSRYLPGGKPARAYPLAHIAEGAAILAALDRHGLLTNGQVRDLLFADGPNRDGSPRGPAYARKLANLSLRRLWEGGLVRRQSAILTSARTGGPYLHFYNVLTSAGARAVAEALAASGDGPPRWSRDASPYDGVPIRAVALAGKPVAEGQDKAAGDPARVRNGPVVATVAGVAAWVPRSPLVDVFRSSYKPIRSWWIAVLYRRTTEVFIEGRRRSLP